VSALLIAVPVVLLALVIYACYADALDWWPWNQRYRR
jgi:hypothetical protein